MTAEAATRDAASAHDAQATEEEAAATQIVTGLAKDARDAAGSLFTAPDDALDESLRTMARRLREAAAPVLMANEEDLRAASAAGMSGALLDRLRLVGAAFWPLSSWRPGVRADNLGIGFRSAALTNARPGCGRSG